MSKQFIVETAERGKIFSQYLYINDPKDGKEYR